MDSKKNSSKELKSGFIKKLVLDNNTKERDESDGIKDLSSINFSKVIDYVLKGAPEKEVSDICADINSGAVKFGLDSQAVDLIVNNKDNEKIKQLFKAINISMSIDVDGLSELGSQKFSSLRDMGCNIDKVYVNSGYDEAAERGYTSDVYNTIITRAEKMSASAIKKLPPDATEQDKFMAIYNVVIKNTVYDWDALKQESGRRALTSRNLEGFFIDKTSVCAGTADVLKQLCEMNGIKAEYVQGNAMSGKNDSECYHAWVKVQLDGKWYNADPTWDANKVGRHYEYCLKSDEKFKGHKLDKSYKPTYVRNSNGRDIQESNIVYYESNDSISDLDRYYTRDVDRSIARSNMEITNEQAKESLKTHMPIGMASADVRPLSIFEMIMKFLVKITSVPLNKIKSTVNKRKFNLNELKSITSESKAEEYVKSNAKELGADELSQYKVDPKVADSYTSNENNRQNGDKNKDKEENVR